jgi:hypothetical protein
MRRTRAHVDTGATTEAGTAMNAPTAWPYAGMPKDGL